MKKGNIEKIKISHRIGGVILMVLSSLLCFLFVGVFVEGDFKLLFPASFGLFGFFLGRMFYKGYFMKLEHAKKTKGVYLTKEQIEKLENKIELPIVATPVFLNYGEIAVYYSHAIRQGTQQQTGAFVITNERIIFLSNHKGFELKHQNITSATAYKDGLSFQGKSNSYILLLPRVDLATLAFDCVRTGEIPISGINITDEYDCVDCEDYDEFDADDISSIDGMDGHDFEYFCADLLQKNGFLKVSVTKGSGDQGVDILATKGGIKYAIQCKNYMSVLGNTPIQEVNAGKMFYNCHVGVVMTNSTFTSGAKTLAEATGVLLWDRKELQKLMDNK